MLLIIFLLFLKLSRSESTSKYSVTSNSPPTSPLFPSSPKVSINNYFLSTFILYIKIFLKYYFNFLIIPHLLKSSPPPTKKSTSPNGTSSPSLSPPPSSTYPSSGPKRTLKNGTYKDSYLYYNYSLFYFL